MEGIIKVVILVIFYQLVGGYFIHIDDIESVGFYIEPELVLVQRYIIIGENKEKYYEGRGIYSWLY